MKTRDYFMREGQACASTRNDTRLNLAMHRAPTARERGWLFQGYHLQRGALQKLRAILHAKGYPK